MPGGVYVSGVFHDSALGDKPGLRKRYRGEEWEPADFVIPLAPPHGRAAREKHSAGEKLAHDEFPAGVAVWNEKAFAKMHDILWAGPFITVKAKIAEVLSRFDLGGGELVPVPLYKADLQTPWPEPYYYINFGGPKDTFLPEESKSFRLLARDQKTGNNFYRLHSPSDCDVALSPEALRGADMWMEKHVWHELFLSETLCQALHEVTIDVDLRIARCRIVEG